MRVIVQAWNKDSYQLDLIVFDEKQTRMTDARIKDGLDGLTIDVADFPEAVRFTVSVERD